MKAIRFNSFGGAEVLKYEDAPTPTIGPVEILLQLKAAALNHLDIWVRSGQREKSIPLPHIPGSDGAGIIAQVGSDVHHLKTGDRVLIAPGLSCGVCAKCLSGKDNLCSLYRVLGTKEDGTYAEFVRIPAANAFPIPEGLTFEEAAAIPLVFLTAWHMLVTLAKVQPGEIVLIHAAGSGVGSAAIQIAKMLHAEVITTVGSPAKMAMATQLGADEIINYTTHDFTEEVRKITEKRGVDVVFEHTGAATFEKSITILTKGGRLVTCGATSDYIAKLDIRYVYSRHQTIYGSWMGGRGELTDVLKFFGGENNYLRPVVDKVFPLKDAAAAQRRMEERLSFGKIVLSI